MTDTRGFTLLEMLVAVAIFAIVGALAYTGLSRALAIRAQLKTVRTRWEDRALVYERLSEDLSQARPRPVRDGAGTLVPAFMVRRMGRGVRLNFTTGGPAPVGAGRPLSDLRRVDYTVEHGRLLWRRWAVLDRAPGEHRAREVLLRGVRAFRVSLLAANGTMVRVWPLAGQPTALPAMVQIVLRLKHHRTVRWLFAVGR